MRICSGLSGAIILLLMVVQLLTMLFQFWPSSKLLWFIHFEFTVNLDVVSKGFQTTFPETGAIEFLAFLGLLLSLTVLGWYYRVRLFQGLAFHYALVFGVLIVLDTWFNLPGTLVNWQVGPALILAIAVVACAVLADGCLRIHARYFAVFRA